MTDVALEPATARPGAPKLNEPSPIPARIVFIVLLISGLGYCAYKKVKGLT